MCDGGVVILNIENVEFLERPGSPVVGDVVMAVCVGVASSDRTQTAKHAYLNVQGEWRGSKEYIIAYSVTVHMTIR